MIQENQKLEIWKDIPGYEGHYQASNLGRIKSLKNGKERIRVLTLISSGYYDIMLCKNGNTKVFTVNVLVAMAFLGHVPCGHKKIVDHKDNVKTNNNVNNLQIITQRKNASKDRIGTSKYTGVSWNKKQNKWGSAIFHNKKRIHLGYFDTEIEASKYYKNALKSIKSKSKIAVKHSKRSSKYKGVCFNKKLNKWQSFTSINGKYKHIGVYKNELDAYNSIQEYISKNNINAKS